MQSKMTTRPDRMESLSTCGHQRQQVLHAIRFRARDQDGDTPPSRALLVLDIPIAGVQYIPPALSKRKELAVFLRRKTCLPHSLALVVQCVEGFRFTITRWCLRTSDFATSERAAGPSNRTRVALKMDEKNDQIAYRRIVQDGES